MQSIRGIFMVFILGVCMAVPVLPSDGQEPVTGSGEPLSFAQAADEIAQQVAATFPKLQGLIVGVEGNRVLLDLGSQDRISEGMELQVFREGDEFRHPITGQPLGRMDKEIGLVRVIEVRPRASVTQVVKEEGEGRITKGDLARISRARLFVALPNVDPGEAKGVDVRSITRDLSSALTKTGRFEVVEDRQLRALLTAEGLTMEALTEPEGLKALAEKAKVQALLLGWLGKGKVSLNVQVISLWTGRPLFLARADLHRQRPASSRKGPVAPRQPPGASRPTPTSQPSSFQARKLIVGPEFDFAMRALAVSDFDGDGLNDLAMAGEHRIFIYTFHGQSFKLLWESGIKKDESIIALDGADMNGNGKAELFVTDYHQGDLRSYVLEWKWKKMVEIASEFDLFFRVVPGGDRRKSLYGQSLGKKAMFEAPLYRYRWNGRQYRRDSPLNVPRGTGIFGIASADLNGDGEEELLALGQDGRLEVYDLKGRLLHRRAEGLGDSGTIVEFQPARTLLTLRFGPAQRISIQSRIFAIPSRNGSEPEVVVRQNQATQGGKVLGLRWNGSGFEKLWETRELPGYIADYHLAELGDGGLYLVLISVEGGRNPRSILLAHRLY